MKEFIILHEYLFRKSDFKFAYIFDFEDSNPDKWAVFVQLRTDSEIDPNDQILMGFYSSLEGAQECLKEILNELNS